MMSLLQSSFWPGLFAFFSVLFAFLMLADFSLYVAGRYRERYLKEASVNLDDVLIQLPAGRIFDLSWALSVAGAVVTIVICTSYAESLSWKWMILLAALVGGILFPVPLLVLRVIRSKRLFKFNIQLEDALNLIASSLKAGFSINQALEEVAEQNIHPVSVEFKLLVQEIQLGVPLEQALENMNRRVHSDDFELVTTAILTARQTGGELTATLERVAALIRERVRIANKLHAITAMGRLQAIMIGSMPYLLLFGLSKVNPEMMSVFTGSFWGIAALIVVTILDVIGFFVIRKITTIEV